LRDEGGFVSLNDTSGIQSKQRGAYYTPTDVAHALVSWAAPNKTDRLIDPACGDGIFVANHQNSVGVERFPPAAAMARNRAPAAIIHEADFFTWAAETRERFDAAVGNPPFIRYQLFSGEQRRSALDFCKLQGAQFSGLTSSWAPFVVAASALLNRGGRIAFVVPAEIGHAPYARPLLDYLVRHFTWVQVISIKEKLFPDLSEDCWLLYCEGFGGVARGIALTKLEQFTFSPAPPSDGEWIPISDWSSNFGGRLRPFLLNRTIREFYSAITTDKKTFTLSKLTRIGIGYVSGDNDFFHLRPSRAQVLGIQPEFLAPTVRNSRTVDGLEVMAKSIRDWEKADLQYLLLRLEKHLRPSKEVQRYLDSEEGRSVRQNYKCRTREPWYSVPDVRVPDFFLTYMSGDRPSLIRNRAACTAPNTLHVLQVRNKRSISAIANAWDAPLTRLSCEIEGHPLGGGMLKLEVKEAEKVLLSQRTFTKVDERLLGEGVRELKTWRHYAA
jgi:adenine-specific DNA-methyltransferase